jgi:hypothetical protein
MPTIFSLIQSEYNLPDVFYLDLWPLFPEPLLVTGNLAVADRFLNDYTRHPMILNSALQPLVGGCRGLVSPDRSEWHDSRSIIRIAFSVTNVVHFLPKAAEYSMQLRAALLDHAVTGRRFPMIEPIQKWGADLTFQFLLGDDTAVQRGGWGAQANSDIQTIIAQADDPVSWNPWTLRQRTKTRKSCQERVRSRIRTALNDALQRGRLTSQNKFVPLLDSLAAKYKEQYPGRTYWDADTLSQHLDTVMTMFLAADVSSMVLTVTFLTLPPPPFSPSLPPKNKSCC